MLSVAFSPTCSTCNTYVLKLSTGQRKKPVSVTSTLLMGGSLFLKILATFDQDSRHVNTRCFTRSPIEDKVGDQGCLVQPSCSIAPTFR